MSDCVGVRCLRGQFHYCRLFLWERAADVDNEALLVRGGVHIDAVRLAALEAQRAVVGGALHTKKCPCIYFQAKLAMDQSQRFAEAIQIMMSRKL